MRQILPRLVTFVLLASPAHACVNASYTPRDERQVTDELVYLILGRFAHHGRPFYVAELARTEALLAHHPDDPTVRNDRAVALLKLQRWKAARRELATVLARHPDNYEAHANLGVLAKKQGRYVEAIGHLQRSLQIKPAGHLGLGDYYLRMARWLAALEAEPGPTRNFLGVAYADGPGAVAVAGDVRLEYLVTLIKNDRHFADGLLVLGDKLFSEGRLQLAVRAYYRALYALDHPRKDVLDARMDGVFAAWRQQAARDAVTVAPRGQVVSRLRHELRTARSWVERFEQVEGELLGRDPSVDFAKVKQVMSERGHDGPAPVEIGLGASRAEPTRGGPPVAMLVLGAVFLAGGLGLLLRSAGRARAAR